MDETRQVDTSVEMTSDVLSTNFDAILDRLKLSAGVKSDRELGEYLGISQSSVSGARKRRQIPPGWVVVVAERSKASADWLFFGGEKKRRTGDPGLSGGPATEQSQPRREMGDIRNNVAHGLPIGTPHFERYSILMSEMVIQDNERLKAENSELNAENRRLNAQIHTLLQENGDLRVALAELRARAAPATGITDGQSDESSRKIA